MNRIVMLLRRLRHERALEGWLAVRAQYRIDHPDWL